jgi:hypothetical protein
MIRAEFEALLADESKLIDGDIHWQVDGDHPLWVEFSAIVHSAGNYPLIVKGSFNQTIPALAYCVLHKTFGRIYGLCLGKGHKNPGGEQIGPKHKHTWRGDLLREKEAYNPEDITAPPSDPVNAWSQFCNEANIRHDGKLSIPPGIAQPSLFV